MVSASHPSGIGGSFSTYIPQAVMLPSGTGDIQVPRYEHTRLHTHSRVYAHAHRKYTKMGTGCLPVVGIMSESFLLYIWLHILNSP